MSRQCPAPLRGLTVPFDSMRRRKRRKREASAARYANAPYRPCDRHVAPRQQRRRGAVRRATSVIALGIRATWCAAGHTETWTFRWQQLDAKRIIDGRNVTQRYSQPSALHHGGGALSLWQYRVWVRSITSFEGFCERLIACACSSPCAS